MKKSKKILTLGVIFLILAIDLMESIAELFYKKGTLSTGLDHITWNNLCDFILRICVSHDFWTGVIIYMFNFFLWMFVLSRIDLSLAFPISSASYIFVAILSMLFLNEKISLLRWGGIVMIVVGIYLMSKSANEKIVPK